jgi:hypothetical protein
MPAGNQPTVSVSGRNATVSWTASTFSTGTAVSGYAVKRYDANGNLQTIGAGCSGAVASTSCTETGVPSGAWKYTVTSKHGNWSGAASPQSATATIAVPSLSFTSSTTVSSLPATLNGNLASFVAGQTVTFRLDNVSTGTVLTGTLSPTPVQSNGSASVAVTVPAGTANGSHTVYVIGSQGDTASAAITVNAPVARSFTTSAWTVSDASSGTAVDTSDGLAATGGPYAFQSTFPTSFDTARYVAFDFNGPLRSGDATSSVNFNFNYLGYNSALGTASTACFYFDVRRVSTGNVLATHGSAGSPVDCNSALTYHQISTPLAEVTSTDIANDLEIRVYMNNSIATNINFEDKATVTGSAGSDSFTLYENQVIDKASGVATTKPWSLASGGDSAIYISDSTWDTSFNAAKFLKLTYPAYVPTGATGVSGTFKYSYKADSVGETNCYYIEVYQGTTLLAAHGTSSVPVSCAGATTYVTDTTALPEVNTAAKANNVVIRVYAKNTGTTSKRKSDADLATLKVDYTG